MPASVKTSRRMNSKSSRLSSPAAAAPTVSGRMLLMNTPRRHAAQQRQSSVGTLELLQLPNWKVWPGASDTDRGASACHRYLLKQLGSLAKGCWLMGCDFPAPGYKGGAWTSVSRRRSSHKRSIWALNSRQRSRSPGGNGVLLSGMAVSGSGRPPRPRGSVCQLSVGGD